MMILFWMLVTTSAGANYSGEIVGTSPILLLGPDVETSKMQLSFKVWANPRKSALKPKKRDLHEGKLLQLLGSDYDPRWMKKNKEKHVLANGVFEESERKTVRALRALVDNNGYSNETNDTNDGDSLKLPEDLPEQYRELVKAWLVRRATCPIRFTWNDLGPYFWPRWIKRGECVGNATCSWPPGMACTPGTAKILNILRWHCRLRKTMRKNRKRKNKNNEVSEKDRKRNNNNGRKKKRKKYRCMWIKVPYPVPEDCICSCKSL